MRSAVHSTFGDPATVLAMEERPVPTPGPGQVRVKTILASIHNHDLLTVAGTYGYKPELPAIGGSEAVGTIDLLGDGVEGIQIGQRVSAGGLHGAWAEYFIAEAHSVVPLPGSISDETAAQLIGMPLSALFLLNFIEAKSGQWIVQNAATGAVAKVMAMVARQRGIKVINLVRRPEAVDELRALGIENAVATSSASWRSDIAAIVGAEPIASVIDSVGGEASGELLSLVGDGGMLVSFGGMSGKPMQISSGNLIFKQAIVKGFWLSKLLRTTPPQETGKLIAELVGLVATGAVTLQVGGIFDISDIAKAAAASSETGRTGKILLRP
jgi:NADPH:quinone reductase-like Zn-dependent oxidoreductase